MYVRKVPADRFKAAQKKIKKEYEGMLAIAPKLEPVDMHGHFVPMGKKSSNLTRMAECIQESFGLTEGGV